MMKKLIILVVGLSVLLVGIAMLALPGPAIIVIPAGLAILGTEFVWARKLLQKMKNEAVKMGSRVAGKPKQPTTVKQEDEKCCP
jgi:uncharacterized protein (TIGR02611 family)